MNRFPSEDPHNSLLTSQDLAFSEEKDLPNTTDDSDEDYAPTYCFMAKGAKVTECYLSELSDDGSGDEFGPSYVKLASLATKQQRALEKVQYMLDKSDDMLGEEMDQSKALAESL